MSLSSMTAEPIAVAQLKSALSRGTVSHAYLFSGQAYTRKALGLAFAKAILCPESPDDSCGRCPACRKIDHENHEDLLWVCKDGNSIRKDAVLDIIETLSYKPFGSRTVVVIDDADTMTISAQNKLLKTLEEPPGPAVILLLSERQEGLLETIRSRCIAFQLQDDTGVRAQDAVVAAQSMIELSRINGPYYKRAALLEPFLGERERCMDLLDAMEDQLGVALRVADWTLPEVRQAILEVEKARRSLKMGYHIGYTMKNLCLCMDMRRITEDILWQK